MNHNLLAMPIVIPFITAVISMIVAKHRILRRTVSFAGAFGLLLVGGLILNEVHSNGILVLQMGKWAAPFGITFVADHLSAIMVLLTGIIAVVGVLYSLADVDEKRASFGYNALLHVLFGALCGAFLAGDLFNMYVWFELILMSSFSILALGGEKAQIDGAIKYIAINLVATLMFLCGIVLLYGITGTLNMADLHVKIKEVTNTGLLTSIAMLFMMGFGIKAAVFPMYFWLPASYHTPPVAVSAIFSGLLTKVGVYAFIRVFTLIFTHDIAYTHGFLLVIAAFTMVSGVLGAASHNEFRKILLFHIVSQIGYLIMGLALFTASAMMGTIYFLGHIIIVKTNLLLISGVVRQHQGTLELKNIGGYYKSAPFLAIMFFLSAFSLAGFPPLSGFWAKFALIRASLEQGNYWIAAVALVVGLLTAYSMTKIWGEAFWKPHPKATTDEIPKIRELTTGQRWLMYGPIAALTVLMLVMGLWPEPFFELANVAAQELFNPNNYVNAVLGGVR